MIGANLTNCAVMYKKRDSRKLWYSGTYLQWEGHTSDFRRIKKTNPARAKKKKVFRGGAEWSPFTFVFKAFNIWHNVTVKFHKISLFFFFLRVGIKKNKRLKKIYDLWMRQHIQGQNTHTNYRPRMGWLFKKNKMHLANAFNHRASVTLSGEPQSLPADVQQETTEATNFALFFLSLCFINELKSTWVLLWYVATVLHVCESGVRGQKRERGCHHYFIAHCDENGKRRKWAAKTWPESPSLRGRFFFLLNF